MVASRQFAPLTTLVAVALLTAMPASPASAARKAPTRAERSALRAAQRFERVVRRAKTPVKARRRNLKLTAYGRRLLARRQWCDGLAALGRVSGHAAVRRALASVEKAVARGRLAKACQAATTTLTMKSGRVSGAPYAAAPPLPPDSNENEQGEDRELPSGPFRPGATKGAPTQTGQAAGLASAGEPFGAHAALVTDPVQAFITTDLGNSNWTGSVQDPTEASSANVALVAVNRNFGYSTDGGKTFTYRDPTTIFPAADGNICCDMVLQYDKATNRFFWLIQYGCSPGCDSSSTSENRYRLAIASPEQVASSGGTAWKYFDFTSKTFDEAKQWMDFPDMALGDSSLYFTFDFPRKGAAAWVRVKTADLVNLNSVGFRYYKKTGDYVLKTVQNTHTRGWIARRKDDSDFELTHWDDGSIYVYHHTVGFPTPPTENCAENGTDGKNFLAMFGCGGFSSSIGGAAQRSNGDIWLGWTAGRRIKGKSTDLFPHSHVQLLTIDPTTLAVTRNRAIWNNDYAFAYPGLSASDANEVVMTYVSGGGTAGYFNWGVGFVTNTESFARVATGQAGAVRIGDYYTARPAYPGTKRFSAAGYVKDSAGNFHPIWALFGRKGDKPVTVKSLPIGVLVPLPPVVIKPPVVLPPVQTPTSLKLTCPTQVPAPGQAPGPTVSATLSPAVGGAPVTLTFTRPQTPLVVPRTTDAAGTVSYDLTLVSGDRAQTITVAAHYPGDATHTSADATCQIQVA